MSLTPFVYVAVSLGDCQPNDTVPLSDATFKHVTTVLRLKPGMPVVICDGVGVTVEAHVADSKAVIVAAQATTRNPETPVITLVQAIPKLRKLDTVVRLASEIGVDVLLPVATARSQASVADVNLPKQSERLHAIAHAAGEQARRPQRLHVADAVSYEQLFGRLKDTPTVLLDHSGDGLHTVLTGLKPRIDANGQVALVIGPEGGFTDAETALAASYGAGVARLGASVLRTEHAGIAAVSAAAMLLGRFAS